MNAIELLKKDHAEAMNMIEQIESVENGTPTGDAGMSTFNRLKEALTLHTRMEEQIFYPALENHDATRDLISESYEEHRRVDGLLNELSAPGDQWENQLGELKESISHHVDEEENRLFPQAERILGQDRLQEMGRRMDEMKGGQSESLRAGM
ncbi:MAG TPA: hemerythrin domain-containing protein [Pyrinomonadaceae bacterium]|nr:hemerythrin domain-containing protein [Pyrinomonadaceae bacterium]